MIGGNDIGCSSLSCPPLSGPTRLRTIPLLAFWNGRLIGTQVGKAPNSRDADTNSLTVRTTSASLIAVSEHGYGVALISESKYGYSVQGNIMRLSLLRSPTSPDPECDQGRHEFSFAVYPHAGDYGQSDVQNVAFAFSTPMRSECRVTIYMLMSRAILQTAFQSAYRFPPYPPKPILGDHGDHQTRRKRFRRK